MTDATKIARVAERNGWQYRGDYSGRCMFGATCPGIVCGRDEVNRARAAVRRAGIKGEPSLDNMGRDMIVYWSSVAGEVFETAD